MKKKIFHSLSLFLIVAFVLSLAVPSANVTAADKDQKKKVLVAYFSATGTTEAAAEMVRKATGGTLYQIEAEEPYTDEDSDYNEDCRANIEQDDEGSSCNH